MKFDITVVLDRSGSMESGKADHIGGLRSFIQENQNKGETDFTLVQFDSNDPFELVYNKVDINTIDVSNINLMPRGGTPLWDAVGRTVSHIESTKKAEETQTVLLVVTDGGENSSREWDRVKLKTLMDEKSKSWKVLYLGANQDAFAEASSMGVAQAATINYAATTGGIQNTYSAMSRSVNSMRTSYLKGGTVTDALDAADFTEQERINCSTGK